MDRYGTDVLAGDWKVPKRGRAVETPADHGLVVEEVTTDWCGEIVEVDRDLHTVTLEDRRNKRRTFPLGTGFLLEGKPVILVPPVTKVAPRKPTRTASGSIAVHDAEARVARASRIFVEGRHDAELVEKVWGDDLRIEGVVVEYLGGVDDLAEHLRDFRPGPNRRVGVLVDHLVTGSKESRIAQGIARDPSCARAVEGEQSIGLLDGGCVQGRVALADLAQGPVHRLLHEIPAVAGMLLDQRQPGQEGFIRLLLQVERGPGGTRSVVRPAAKSVPRAVGCGCPSRSCAPTTSTCRCRCRRAWTTSRRSSCASWRPRACRCS